MRPAVPRLLLSASLSSLLAPAAVAGPEDLFETYRFDGIEEVVGDGTYAYGHHHADSDRYCWGRVLRVTLATGAVTSVRGPCYATDFVVRGGLVFIAAQDPYEPVTSGIFRYDFVTDGVRIVETPAVSLAQDATYLYYGDGTAVHRVLPDGKDDTVLSATGGQAQLFADASWIVGLENRTLWRLPKTGGAPALVATLGSATSSPLLDAGELLWVDAGRRIRRVPIAGGTPATFYATLEDDVRGLAVTGDYVYWSSDLDIKRRLRAGSTVTERVDTAETSSEVVGADATGVYYTRWSTPAPPRLQLRRLGVADVAAPVCSDSPVQLAPAAAPMGLSATGTWVYYTEGDAVRRVWKNGGTVDVMALNQPGARSLYADATGLSWVTDSGVNTTPYEWPDAGAFHTADSEDVKGTVDGGDLYYIDGPQIIGPGDPGTLAAGVAPYRMALGDRYLYFTDRGDGTVRRVPRTGGAVQLLATVSSGSIGDLVNDATGVFIGVDDGATGRILRVPVSGGAATVVASGSFSPYDLHESGSYVYFTSQGPGPESVYRVAKTGGTPVVRASGGEAWELDALGGCLYYTTGSGINVVSKF